MKKEFKRDLQHTQMILSGGSLPDQDAYVMRMLTEHAVSGLLPCKLTCVNESIHLYYDISHVQTWETICQASPVQKELLQLFFSSLADLIEELENCLLDPDGLILTADMIFIQAEQKQFLFCYYPAQQSSTEEQLRLLSEDLLSRLDRRDEEAIVAGYTFFQICEAGEITAASLRKLLAKRTAQQEESRSEEEQEHAALMDAFFAEEEERPLFGSLWEKGKRWLQSRTWLRHRQEEEKVDWSEPFQKKKETGTTLADRLLMPEYEKEEATTLLTPDRTKQGPRARLVPESGGQQEPIFLEKEKYYIGKTGSQATLQLPSPAVSRLQACLQWKADTYVLTDLNSRNGTQVQGAYLLPEEERPLSDGDRICFADLAYHYEANASFAFANTSSRTESVSSSVFQGPNT